MIRHAALGSNTYTRRRALLQLVRAGSVSLGGNSKDKIYGLLTCATGKRLKTENRVFFIDHVEAIRRVYRPCGRCLPAAYSAWLAGQSSINNNGHE